MSVHNTIYVSKVIYKCRAPILLLPVSNLSSILTLSTLRLCECAIMLIRLSLSLTIVVLFHCFRRLKAEKDRSLGMDPIGMSK